jgi:acetyl esterase
MFEPIEKQALDVALVEVDRRWRESGIPGLYDGNNGPVCRERARNIRALLYPKPKLPQGDITALTIDGPDGTALPVRIVRPVSGTPTGTLVYYHGGGGVVVVNVDYRLAPEHKFPAAYDDAVAAMVWAHHNRAQLGGADKPLAVGGDSAGGNLAATAALHARDAGISLAAQLLLYPATNLSGREGPEQSYLGDGEVGVALARDPRASPLLAASLAGLAPAIIGVGAHDFLYQDNMTYAAALQQAGVPVLLRQFDNLNHGFYSYTAISTWCEAAANLVSDDLRQQLTA